MRTIYLHPELMAREVVAMARQVGGRLVWLGGHLCIRTGGMPCAH